MVLAEIMAAFMGCTVCCWCHALPSLMVAGGGPGGAGAGGRRAGFTCANVGEPQLFPELPDALSHLGAGTRSCWFQMVAWRVRGMNAEFWWVAVRATVSSSHRPATRCGPVCLWESGVGLLGDEHDLDSVLLMGPTRGILKHAMCMSVLSPAWVAAADAATIFGA